MSSRSSSLDAHAQLLRVVRDIRRRWRWKLALKGIALVIAGGFLLFLLSSLALQHFAFSAAAVVIVRVLVYLGLVGLLVWFLIRPLSRRVSDERVALYLEEHEPSLQSALVSALETGSISDEARVSPALARRTVEAAIQRCREIGGGQRIERRSVQRSGALLAGAAMLGLLLILISPAFLRHGASVLFFPFGAAEAANPYAIEVLPGDVTIPRGADQLVSAQLQNFGAEPVEVIFRAAGDSLFERIPMLALNDSAAYELVLFALDKPTEYFVEAGGVRSPVFRISVADLPYVERLALEYHFPAYTGLEPRRVEDAGDIAAVRGTRVRVLVAPTMPVPAGRIVLDGGESIALAPDSAGWFAGELQVEEEGLYGIELQGPDNEPVTASPQYTIDVLSDEAPSVAFAEPGRDTRATPIEEVFLEARAEDDFGISRLELVYSVNGAPEKTIDLYRGAKPLREVSAGHTFYLEELELQPGDFISYYARAADNDAIGSRKQATSDIYFLQITPFSRDFRQAEERGGGAQGGEGAGGEADADGALSQRQREIIAATFNLIRDRERYTQKEVDENLVTIGLAQQALREQVETLTQRMNNRGVTGDSSFRKIAELLPRAGAEMATATDSLRQNAPQGALPAQQRALQHLQRAEAEYRDVQVSAGGQSQGSGGSPSAEDLADLFGLELDKLRNQYETVERGERKQEQEQIDETIERLKELAQRQERENERLRLEALAQRNQRQAAEAQRQMAEEAEEAARRLERLSRENQRPELMDAARRLKEAADAMRRSAAEGGSGNTAEAERALNRLGEAQRQLERNRSTGREEDVENALGRANRLAEEQQGIAEEMRGLPGAGSERAERARRLIDRKERQAAEVADLERQLDRLAAETRREQKEASRELSEAAGSIRENNLEENIRRSRAGTQPGAPPEYVERFEEEIGEGIDELREQLAEARAAMDRSDEQRASETMERTRDLASGLESLRERTRAAQEQDPASDQQGQGDQAEPADPEAQQQQQGQAGQQGGESSEPGRAAGGQNSGARSGFAPGGETVTDGRPGDPAPLNPDQIRQFRNEISERLEQAQELRRRLAAEGRDVGDLDAVIRGLRALDDQRVYADAAELERLQTAIVEGLKEFEFGLRRELEGPAADKLFLSGGDEVPEGYRELVEEYYRSLSERPRR